MNYAFLLAGGVSAFALVLHIMLGRRRDAPLPSLDRMVHLDAVFGRHVATLLLAAMSLGFAHAARAPDAADLAIALTALALLTALLRLALALRLRAPGLDIREWGLTAIAGALGVTGLQLG